MEYKLAKKKVFGANEHFLIMAWLYQRCIILINLKISRIYTILLALN